MEKFYGPVLPPGLESASRNVTDREDDSNDYSGSEIGPVLPPELKKRCSEDRGGDCKEIVFDSSNDDDDDDGKKSIPVKNKEMYGPALPPGFIQGRTSAVSTVVGPLLPPGMTKADLRDEVESEGDDESEDAEDLIGPVPFTCDHEVTNAGALRDIERRASQMKNRLITGSNVELKREEWMTVLPPDLKKTFGVGPRSFLRQTPSTSGDRSVWTDTPSEREAREKAGDQNDDKAQISVPTFEDLHQNRYNQEMNRRVEEYSAATGTRKESLLDTHTKNLKRKKKDEGEKPKERRPFDRDVDLKANVIDDAKRKALIKQSRQLNDKFSHGKGHFL